MIDRRDLQARIDALPRVSLAHLPTPLDECPRAAAGLGLDRLRIKRDDCTGLGFGGNKVRQHEFVLGDALDAGFDTVIQGSASQSNHSRQLAAAGAKLGLEVHLMPKQDHMSDPIQGNHLISRRFGATIHPLAATESTIAAKEALAEELRADGKTPYLVGMGADRSLALAAVAYVQAMIELIDQCAGALPQVIYSGSQGSTQVGLLLGARLLGLDVQVVGVNPLDDRHEAYLSVQQILDVGAAAAGLLGLDSPLALEDIVNDTRFVGEAYGIPSPAGLEAMDLLGTSEGILLDPIYSGKAFSGLMALTQEQDVSDALFLHTGGLPALFAYADQLEANG